MCWSGGASTVLALTGLGMSAYFIKTGERKEFCLALFYFSLMEVLQLASYSYINQCAMPMSKIHTVLGYIHIAFQPMFINMVALCFIPDAVRHKIAPYVYCLCWITVVPFMLKAYPFSDTSLCTVGQGTICVPFACAYKENWQIGGIWSLSNLTSQLWIVLSKDLQFLGVQAKLYLLTGLVLPIVYGSWRIILATVLLIPGVAYIGMSHLSELPALWCLYSIAFCCTLMQTPIRKYLHVYRWPFYQYILSKYTQPLTETQSKTIIEQETPIETNTTTSPIHPNTLPLHELQWAYWLSKFSVPMVKTMNIIGRKRFQGSINKIALDAALQLVLQKQEIFSYHLHRFYPLHTLCTKPSMHFRQSTEISLLSLSDALVETYLNQQYANLCYEKTWRENRPWISVDLYVLKHEQTEIQICMSQLIADEVSMDILFRELSNAYLFFTHQSHAYVLDSFQSYQHYIQQQQYCLSQQANTDEDFWNQYLQDSDLLRVPKQFIRSHRESVPTYLALPESFIQKLRMFCAEHQFALHDVLYAASSLALAKCCGNESNTLCISSIKTTRDDPEYTNTIGCFLRMDTIKLVFQWKSTLLDISRQVQYAHAETAEYQQAPTLVKLAAIGKRSKVIKPVRKFIVNHGLTFAAKCFPRWQINQSMIHACENIAFSARKRKFLVCVDIDQHFFTDHNSAKQSMLFGLSKRDIPLFTQPVQIVRSVINISFHRSNDQNIPFIAIAGHVSAEFKHRFSDILIALIQDAQHHVSEYNPCIHTEESVI